MALLRSLLYLHALVWGVVGAALALFPAPLLERVFGQPPMTEYAWVRLAGVLLFSMAMLMVLVGHRAVELWWWSWAFVLSTGAVAALLTLNAAFGVEPGASSVLWWVGAIVSWALGSGLLVGLARAARERPPDRHEPAPAREPHPRRRRDG